MNVSDSVIHGNARVSSSVSNELHRARCLLRNDVQNILSKVENIDDWISLVFLILDEETAPYDGMKLINDVLHKNTMGVSSHLIKHLMRHQAGSFESIYDPIIEALYYIGHHNILENDLQLCSKHNLQQICENLQSISPEQISLYKVFSDLTQDETDQIKTTRLNHWCFNQHKDELFEHFFLRNLTPTNYLQLLTDVYTALELEKNSLANSIRRFAIHKTSVEPVIQFSGLSPDDFYPLPTQEPHGLCIIINVKRFYAPRGEIDDLALDQRFGSDVDKLRLEGTFKLFGFEIFKLDNPTRSDVQNLFQKLRTTGRLWAMKCLAVCIMTHGDVNDQIYMADREPISITEMRKLCYSRAMIGKPKLYIVQACRGENRLRPVILQFDHTTMSSNSETDCLIAAATVRGYSAIRSQSSGTWFITDLCACLQEFGHCAPLKTVLRKTKEKLNKRVENFEGRYVTQAPEDIDTLTKEVQLIRARESTFLDGIVDLTMLDILDDMIDAWVEEEADELQGEQTFLCCDL